MLAKLLHSITTLFLFGASIYGAQAQGTKLYLNPQLNLGIITGYDHAKGAGLDFGDLNRSIGIELRGGYKIKPNLCVFTGFGYTSYHYRMVVRARIEGADTIRQQRQEFFEVPLGLRYSTYHGPRSFKTRFYGAAGIKACFLSDARHDYRSKDGLAADGNIVRPEDFNKLWVRMFLEGGLDIPMDYDSAILIGLSVSHGLSRNANTEGALTRDNYGVLVIGGNIGVKFGF